MLMLVVFLLGGVTGASLDRFWLLKTQPYQRSGRERGPDKMIERLKEDLKLTDEQAATVRIIFADMRKEFSPSRFNECPGVKESRDKSRARVRAILNLEQQKKYDEINAKRDAEMLERSKSDETKAEEKK
ncbi:MAG: hypothetical protein ACKVZH_03840 [Blastocatellia bacterium]